jgi:hypothetical protein
VRQLEIEHPGHLAATRDEPEERDKRDLPEKKKPVGSAGAVRNDRWTRHG